MQKYLLHERTGYLMKGTVFLSLQFRLEDDCEMGQGNSSEN